MPREEMPGENLPDGIVEVAFEQRTQRQIMLLSRLRRVPALQGDDIGKPVSDECGKDSF